jgi:hypothetical protein
MFVQLGDIKKRSPSTGFANAVGEESGVKKNVVGDNGHENENLASTTLKVLPGLQVTSHEIVTSTKNRKIGYIKPWFSSLEKPEVALLWNFHDSTRATQLERAMVNDEFDPPLELTATYEHPLIPSS